MLIRADSLSETVDAVHESITDAVSLSDKVRITVARWIASRQGLPGAYANTFAGFDDERHRGIKLFTGERVNSASARHILGEETCRALIQLNVRDKAVRNSLGLATEGLLQCLERAAKDPRYKNPGLFCCGKCTVGLWRHLAVGGLDRQEERLQKGVRTLRTRRDGAGGWRAYPFWYTVLLLAEVKTPSSTAELRYAAAALERVANRAATSRVALRRQKLATRILQII